MTTTQDLMDARHDAEHVALVSDLATTRLLAKACVTIIDAMLERGGNNVEAVGDLAVSSSAGSVAPNLVAGELERPPRTSPLADWCQARVRYTAPVLISDYDGWRSL